MWIRESNGAVAQAAGGGQGGDGGSQNGDNHLNGLPLDGLPGLFLDFVEEIHDNKTIGFVLKTTFCFEDNFFVLKITFLF